MSSPRGQSAGTTAGPLTTTDGQRGVFQTFPCHRPPLRWHRPSVTCAADPRLQELRPDPDTRSMQEAHPRKAYRTSFSLAPCKLQMVGHHPRPLSPHPHVRERSDRTKIFRRPLTPTLYHARPLPVNVGLAHNVQSLRRSTWHPPSNRLSPATPAPTTRRVTAPAPAPDRLIGSQRPGNGVNAQTHIPALPLRQNAATHSYSSCHGKKKGHPTVKQDAPDRAMKKDCKCHHHEAQAAKIPRSIRHCTTMPAQSQAREISVTGGVLPGPWLFDRRLRFHNGGAGLPGWLSA